MQLSDVKIGLEVIRSKGDYVVGNIGIVVAINVEKGRAQVDWYDTVCTWVKVEVIEDYSIPHEITKYSFNNKTCRHTWPKYIKK